MTAEKHPNASRIAFARKRRGFTMAAFAAAIGVHPRSVTGWESGEYSPEPENVAAMARVLRFPEEFFYQDDIESFAPEQVSFRALSKMTAAQRDAALGAGTIATLLNRWIEQRFDLPAARVPDLSQERHPEAAADALRREWGLGELPVKNMVHLLESKGIRVFSLAINAQEVDAFSTWRQSTPFVFLNTKKSAERSRFDAAHELGHLILHRHGAPQGQDAEKEANTFASAFLMPRASVLAVAPRLTTVDHLVKLKKYWTVSAMALAYRLHHIGVLTDWHYRSLCIEMASRGYRDKEPDGSRRELSQVLSKVLSSVRAEGQSKASVANDLHVLPEDLEELIFGLTLTGLTPTAGAGPTPSSRVPDLKVVGQKH